MQDTVLFVDDNGEILELFRHMLRNESYAVEIARTAVGAFEVLASRHIAVVVADEGMPGMSGTELLARVQLDYPEAVRVMVTGQACVEVAMRAINEGNVFRFLTKPVCMSDLIDTLRDAVATSQAASIPNVADPNARRRRSEIAQLESEWQGLTHVERDASGAIIVDETGDDLAEVLREVEDGRSDRAGHRRA